ncbi:PTS system IIA component, Glc family [Selenomonas sp. WCT3]|uniref:PTS sugar transporter subunit IIA n=1 Tax=Selenomonas sp. WCT3 TaxID=3158785 RepID=UPI0008868D32|nr:PTS system IIA component, Glc family [Selenomonas ruminantium]
MFGLFGFGKKEKAIASPVAGNILDITEVNDAVFSQKMMGDGFAVEPAEGADTITAPCDGTIKLLADTLHAVAIESEGLEVLIHVGIDTVELGGRGFEALTQQGAKVSRGDALIRFDAASIKQEGKPLTTIIALTNGDEKAKKIEKHLDDAQRVLTVQL